MGPKFSSLLYPLFICLFSFTFCKPMNKRNSLEGDISGIEMDPFKFNSSLFANFQYAAPSRTAKKWPNGIVPYTFEQDFDDEWREKIREALAYLMQSVNLNGQECIQFVERTNEENYISVFNGPGCFSNIGQSGGKQDLSLNINGCFLRDIIVRKFMQALGFNHEQSYPDRNEYLRMGPENRINRQSFDTNFGKYLTDTIIERRPYDYESAMRYELYPFGKYAKNSIFQLNQGPTIGQRESLSQNDINEIRKYYECADVVEIKWAEDKGQHFFWATGCDFSGNDLKQVTSKSGECSTICRQTDGCTHFSFNIESGTCFLKQNSVDKSKAIKVGQSVGLCGYLTQINGCADESENCDYWASVGQCKTSADYMLTKCCKSCSKFNCKNENENCEYWASNGHCETNPGYMLTNCCLSCKNSKSEKCVNENENCEYWASHGECEAYSEYMLTKCCKSCQTAKKPADTLK